MTYRDRDPSDIRDPRIGMERQIDPTQRATPRQAIWSWVAAIAIVVVLGVVFYGLNAADNARTAATPPAATVTPATETTGQSGGAASPAQPSNDRSGAQQDGQPKGNDAPKAKDAK